MAARTYSSSTAGAKATVGIDFLTAVRTPDYSCHYAPFCYEKLSIIIHLETSETNYRDFYEDW